VRAAYDNQLVFSWAFGITPIGWLGFRIKTTLYEILLGLA